MKKARFLADLPDWRTDAAVYELNPPVQYDDHAFTTYVIVSAVTAFDTGRPETLIFPAERRGDTFDTITMLDLPGSYRGGMSHDRALEGAGYKIVGKRYITIEMDNEKGEARPKVEVPAW